ncbi:long-chain-fatty-acid--CoA ligase [Mesobacterium pallidum]|uniref:long-chain-fatty-acid--CoA ligase n=1 Tax=Mesobacterium pallidum TaxID=2872037 RepID=UPI001EE3092C|nr:long-chain-fatty-acid--CoA ligase [Mesobacterium pallidum]
MLGQMMHRPLSIIEILRFAAEAHGPAEIVSVRTEGDIHRTTYAETYGRVAQLAHGLAGLGIGQGDRVATLAWNGYRHLELYYAIAGYGAVCHTINPRLSAEQFLYIVNHAEDRVLFLDTTFVPLVEALADHLPKGLKLVLMTDRAHMPDSKLDMLCYEDLLEGQPTTYDWPELDENTAAALCYTSGTTGNPKGALYSHRSTVLHALMTAVTLHTSLREGNRILPVVPLFHVNAWGLPYSAPLTGAALIFPGPKLDGASLWDLMEAEKVTAAWGVPTVWQGLQAEIAKRGRNPEGFAEVVVGGSAAPRSMIESFEKSGVNVCHAWGMTEMSPIGTHGLLSKYHEDLPFDQKMKLKSLQGRRVFGVDLKITDEAGNPLPHDGKSQGELFVRGNAIISGYFKNAEATEAAMDADGWFGTGDIATIAPDGFLVLRDRSKDLIKSGGEWISSIDLENIVMAHPKVSSCAVIAIPHPKWDERPLLVVVPAGEDKPTKDELDEMLLEHVARWQLPDALEFVEALPLTATGKVSKLTLRQQFEGYKLPDMG